MNCELCGGCGIFFFLLLFLLIELRQKFLLNGHCEKEFKKKKVANQQDNIDNGLCTVRMYLKTTSFDRDNE